jgi:hypothetical protein
MSLMFKTHIDRVRFDVYAELYWSKIKVPFIFSGTGGGILLEKKDGYKNYWDVAKWIRTKKVTETAIMTEPCPQDPTSQSLRHTTAQNVPDAMRQFSLNPQQNSQTQQGPQLIQGKQTPGSILYPQFELHLNLTYSKEPELVGFVRA